MLGSMLFGLGILGSLAGPPAIEAPSQPESVQRLVERIDKYYALLRERDHAGTYEMVGSQWRKGGHDRKDWVRYGRRAASSIRFLSGEVKQVRIDGKRAKVHMAIRGKTREGLLRWEEAVEEEDEFWILEVGDWYFIPFKPSDWDDTRALEVPVPERPMKVDIREKD